jgi:hypothetical protein
VTDLTTAIPLVRKSVAALLRIRRTEPEGITPGTVQPARFEAHVGGSAFCVADDRYLVTAFHILNGGQPPKEGDRFHALIVPDNGDRGFHFPIVGCPVVRPDLDIVVLEVGRCATTGIHLPSLPVSLAPRPDGTRVVTMGYPSPTIKGLNIDPSGNFMGGAHFFLKSHANEGIVSGQYVINDILLYELNVGWHHGESGGPVVAIGDRPEVFSVMQHYRNIESPHGIVAGPHRGCALSNIRGELLGLGIEAV